MKSSDDKYPELYQVTYYDLCYEITTIHTRDKEKSFFLFKCLDIDTSNDKNIDVSYLNYYLLV